MRQLSKITILAAILVLFLVAPAFSWDDVGHKITGYHCMAADVAAGPGERDPHLAHRTGDSTLAVYYQPYGAESDDARKLEYFTARPDLGRYCPRFRGRFGF